MAMTDNTRGALFMATAMAAFAINDALVKSLTADLNIAQIMAKPDVDGALIGGASLDAEEFASIVRFREHVAR